MLAYQEWVKTVPKVVTADPLWRMEVYRLSEYIAYLAFDDSDIIAVKKHRISLADQLYRATASISANIAEGYGDTSDKEQGRFNRYALRSAREARGWYLKALPLLGEECSNSRFALLESIIRLLIRMNTNHSGYSFKEDSEGYEIE
jgi:four helix bundle protein